MKLVPVIISVRGIHTMGRAPLNGAGRIWRKRLNIVAKAILYRNNKVEILALYKLLMVFITEQ